MRASTLVPTELLVVIGLCSLQCSETTNENLRPNAVCSVTQIHGAGNFYGDFDIQPSIAVPDENGGFLIALNLHTQAPKTALREGNGSETPLQNENNYSIALRYENGFELKWLTLRNTWMERAIPTAEGGALLVVGDNQEKAPYVLERSLEKVGPNGELEWTIVATDVLTTENAIATLSLIEPVDPAAECYLSWQLDWYSWNGEPTGETTCLNYIEGDMPIFNLTPKVHPISDGGFYLVTSTYESKQQLLVLRYDPLGNLLWMNKSIGQPEGAIEMDFITRLKNDDALLIGGNFGGSVRFVSTSDDKVLSTSGAYFLLEYNTSGELAWATTPDTENDGGGSTILGFNPLNTNETVVLGHVSEETAFEPTEQKPITVDDKDILAVYDEEGTLSWLSTGLIYKGELNLKQVVATSSSEMVVVAHSKEGAELLLADSQWKKLESSGGHGDVSIIRLCNAD